MKRHELFFKCRKIVLKGKKNKVGFLALPSKLICKMINRSYGSGIPIRSEIEEFDAPHGFSGIFISKKAVIGKNCTIYQQVTIGSNEDKASSHYGAPKIGNNVLIGAGAKIIGNIKIGDNVKVGSGCVVSEDIPDNSTVVMPHPRIIPKKGAK